MTHAAWPTAGAVDETAVAQFEYLREVMSWWRGKMKLAMAPPKKPPAMVSPQPLLYTIVHVHVHGQVQLHVHVQIPVQAHAFAQEYTAVPSRH